MKQMHKRADKVTRAQLQKMLPGGLQTYLQRMHNASDGVHPIMTMQRKSGILLEVHTMQERQPTFMMTTSGKRSRVTVHELADAMHALYNWLNNTNSHGPIILTWQDMQESWQPTDDERGEIISDMAFQMPLDEWQQAWLHRNPEVIGSDIAQMVMAAACVEMLQKLNLMHEQFETTVAMPETYGISMRHGTHGMVNNDLTNQLNQLKNTLQNAINTNA